MLVGCSIQQARDGGCLRGLDLLIERGELVAADADGVEALRLRETAGATEGRETGG